MRISDWSSDVCSSDLGCRHSQPVRPQVSALPHASSLSCCHLHRTGCPGNRQPPICHQFGRIPHRLVLGMNIVHKHRHGLVTCELHAHLSRHARVGNVGGRSVADRSEEHTSELQH